jgi:POT family proton-dependent oligopeptide transporter
VFAWSWYALNESYRNPSPFLKFIIAIVFVGLAFLALGCSTYFANDNHLVNPLWVALSYLLLTLGELLLSPIGLSAVTTLSPRKIMGMMMGIWFVALGFGGQFAGFLAKLSNIPESVTDAASQLVIYRGAFLDYAWIAFSVAVALFVIHMFLKNVLETD